MAQQISLALICSVLDSVGRVLCCGRGGGVWEGGGDPAGGGVACWPTSVAV